MPSSDVSANAVAITAIVSVATFSLAAILIIIRVAVRWARLEARAETLDERINAMADNVKEVRDYLLNELSKLGDRIWAFNHPSGKL